MYPKSRMKGVSVCEDELYAANGSRVKSYGTITLALNLSLRHEFLWSFTVADVEMLIIGMDFHSYYNLFIDPRKNTVRDATTKLSASGNGVSAQVISI